MIQVNGANGESLVYDGSTVAKYRHHGKEVSARNPVTTFRQLDVKARKRKKKDPEQEYDVTLVMGTIFVLRITESELPALQALGAELQPFATS